MRNLLVLFVIVAVTAVITYVMDYGGQKRIGNAVAGIQKEQTLDEPAPRFSFRTIDNKDSSIKAQEGKITILHVWATWCPPCIIEYPSLLNFVESMGGKISLVSFSVDKEVEKVNAFYQMLDEPLQDILQKDYIYSVHDPKRVITLDILGVQFYPETIVISPQGRIVKRYVGNFDDWESPETKREFEQYLH
ncbi:MAG: redoxin domain-containing protein [Alphaproteobacteria bacterium]|nr:redoxin domain-containing protein [Alphaproteobacteria bacterium]